MQRRTFLLSAICGGIQWSIAPLRAAAAHPGTSHHVELGTCIRLFFDGSVEILAGRPEGGNGIQTALASIVARAMGASWKSIGIVQAPVDKSRFRSQRMWGSEAIATEHAKLLGIGAAARGSLIRGAATLWRVDEGDLQASDGEVTHPGSGRRIGFGELARKSKLVVVPATAKKATAGSLGLPEIRQYGVGDIVVGQAKFGIDIAVPGMLTAVVAHPAFDEELDTLDAASALRVAGVRKVEITPTLMWREFETSPVDNIAMRQGVAIVADDTWSALQGLQAASIKWRALRPLEPESPAALFDQTLQRLSDNALVEISARVADAKGAQQNVQSVETMHYLPHAAHATMEPLNCLAHWHRGGCELWVSSADPEQIRRLLVAKFGLDPERVTIHMQRMGGSFGRRSQVDFAAKAVWLSRICGRPIKLVSRREDDMTAGLFRPSVATRVRAAFSADGTIADWRHDIVATPRYGDVGRDELNQRATLEKFSGWETFGGADNDLWYPTNTAQVRYAAVDSPVPRASWRAVAHNHNVAAIEMTIERIAVALNRHPLEYRAALWSRRPEAPSAHDDTPRENPQRLAWIAQRLRELIATDPADSVWGFAVYPFSYGTYTYCGVAVLGRVDVPRGAVVIEKLVTVVDCGMVVNRSGALHQVQGGALFGLSSALFDDPFASGTWTPASNFDSLRVLRAADVPAIHTELRQSDESPGPLGEALTPGAMAAVANVVQRLENTRAVVFPLMRPDRAIAQQRMSEVGVKTSARE